MGRVLGRVRLSRSTEESTSEIRQREVITSWAALHGHEVVEWAVDMDVSGSVAPADAPELGPFLATRAHEWDIICAWKLDRFGRTLFGLNDLFRWCTENGKALVSVSESIDLSHWAGRMVASVIAGVAEGELAAIKERTTGSQAKLRELGRWHGGTVPYGYRKVKRDGGWYLEPDEEIAKIVRWIFEQVAAARSVRSIADELTNERFVIAPRGGEWTAQTITRMIRARWPLGQDEHKGKVVVGDDGLPLQRAEPLVTRALWQNANNVLDDRKRPKTRKEEPGALLDVAFCVGCGEKLYYAADRRKSKAYTYWRCSGRTRLRNGCQVAAVPAHQLEEIARESIMEKIGDREVTVPVFVPGEDHAEELEIVREAIASARREKDLGLYDGDEEAYLSRLGALVDRRKVLEAMPSRAAGWTRRGIGETYASVWQREGNIGKRRLLLDSGIKIKAGADPFQFSVYVPEDLIEAAFPMTAT